MPNTLGAYNPLFFAQISLMYLKNALGLANRVYMGYDNERRTSEKGDTIRIRRPSKLTVKNAPNTATDLVTTFIDLQLTQHREVKFEVTDKELAYTGPNTLANPLIRDHIIPAAYELANDVDLFIAPSASAVSHSFIEGAGTASANITVAGILGVWRRLFDQKAPIMDQANMHYMVGGQEYATLAALPEFAQYQGAGQPGVNTQITGQLGMRYGFNFFANQNRQTQTYAAITDFAGALTANAAISATSIAVGSLGTTETMKKGFILKFTSGAENGNQYTVAADVAMSGGAGTITLVQPLRVGAANTDTFAIGDLAAINQGAAATAGQAKAQTLNQNVAFHRNWYALGFGRLPDFSEIPGQLGASIATVQDPITGLSVRSRMYYIPDSSKVGICLDILYGGREIEPELACRHEILAA